MTETTTKQTLGFQAEIKQLLHLMVHSLYSNREIFLRELISNASDAADKLRFVALNDNNLLAEDSELKICVAFDKENKTVTISDNGIGMSRDEVIEHLGTIAKSGTAQFLQSLSGDQQKDSQLIGQFGVGFYSVFVVADRVEVLTRKAGLAADQAVRWESAGEGDFTVEAIDKPTRGTEVIIHLKDDATEFADDWRLRNIIRKYSDHISLPIEMEKQQFDAADETDEKKDKKAKKKKDKAVEMEVVNKATALWTRPRSEITDEEYQEFYKHIGHDFENPLTWSHNKVEGKQEYTSLLYLPKRPPFDLYNRDAPKGLKLYVQRVFIMDDAEQFLPLYLRFVKGVLDSNDLPLNVSREILQSNKAVENMRSALVKRVLEMLSKLAKDEPEQYAEFWKEFGSVLKEGPGEDFANREKIASLLRFYSSTSSGNAEVSLDQYIERMKEGQGKIYYLTSDSYKAAMNSPHLEVFRKKGIEVLLLCERVDEWMMSYLHEYQGKSFQHVAKDNLDLGDLEDEADKKAQETAEEDAKDFVSRMKEVLKDQVQEVKVTHRLTDSPCCLVLGAHDMGNQMRQIMKAAGQFVPESKPILEINPQHPLVERLKEEIQQDRFDELTKILFDQAVLAEGSQLEDPNAYVQRINKLLLELAK